MRLLITAFILAGAQLLPSAHAQQTPHEVVEALFDAMRSGDGNAVRAQIADDAPLARIEADGSVRASAFSDWANWVDTQNPGDADEQIFDVTVNQSGNFASVWAPFVLHYKGELVGCGVNQFSLARTGEIWTIIHGIDTQDGGDCTTFKDRYRQVAP